MRLLAACVLFAVLFTGCSDDAANDQGTDEPVPGPASLVSRLAMEVPTFAWDEQAGIDWWEELSSFAKRDVLLPANDQAAQFIEQGLAAAGLETAIIHYLPSPGAVPASGESPAGVGVHVVVGMKRGTSDPDHAIALGGHYDTQAATVQGAYDNGAGTAMVYNTCITLAKVAMNKTLLCLFFDGEEEGILGSSAYVDDPPAGHPTIDFYLGYDMTGINWPGYPDWKLYSWVQEEFATDLFPLVNATFHDVLGWPIEGAEAFPFNDRNSDEAAFISAGIPSIRFAGGRTAGDYPEYHMPGDTVEFIYGFVGGRENFAAGFGAILEVSFYLALMLDDTTIGDLQEEFAP